MIPAYLSRQGGLEEYVQSDKFALKVIGLQDEVDSCYNLQFYNSGAQSEHMLFR